LAATRLAAANAACTHAKALRSLRGLVHDGIVEWQAPAIKLDELLAAAVARRANQPFGCPALPAKIFRFTAW